MASELQRVKPTETEPVADPLSSMTAQLLSPPFVRDTPAEQVISDPLVDTPMQVLLEQIQPYHLNPRSSPNPQYDAIKASIRQRGLDQPPNITRRPGEENFIIRNGGNTRLAILNELWIETGEERFHNLLCLFRPWTARGEILALTGHLAENELRGNLTYIERSQAVDQARQLYEQECGHSLNQSELATRLTEDGYPVTQPSISRMRATLEHLLPAIPEQLHAGLGRPQIEKLLSLHKAAQRAWERHAPDSEFAPVFQESLTRFDSGEAPFSIERVRDELIGDLAQQLTLDYDELALEMGESDLHRNLLGQLLEPEVPLPRPEPSARPTSSALSADTPSPKPSDTEQLHGRITGLARTITAETAPDIEVLVQPSGYGFACHCSNPESLSPRGHALLWLLQALTGTAPTNTQLAADLSPLLCGGGTAPFERLSDDALNQFFRLIKLMRLLPLDNPSDSSP